MAREEPLGLFGKYELLEKIGSGGMAEVYRARSRGLAGFEKILVIKKIQPTTMQSLCRIGYNTEGECSAF